MVARQRFDNPALQLGYEASFDAMLACVDRRNRLDDAINAMADDREFTPVVYRLGCLRGVAALTAFGLAVEIGDWHRLTGRTIGAYVGLVPSEYSSGDSRGQGGVTKTGNGHVRRLLVEAAWHHRNRTGRPALRRRWELPRRRREPEVRPPTGACTPAGCVRCPPEAPGDRQRRYRPRTGRLVLVARGHPRLTRIPQLSR